MLDEEAAEAVPPEVCRDAEVIDIAATAVVTGENGGGELRAAPDDGAQALVAFQNAGKLLARFVGADPLAGVPEGEDLVVVGEGHGEELEFGRHQEFRSSIVENY